MGDRLYAVTYSDLPEERSEAEALAGAKGGAMSAIERLGRAEIISEAPFSFREYGGFEIGVRVERLGYATLRGFVAQRRLYVLMAGHPQTVDEQVTRFFSSFDLQ